MKPFEFEIGIDELRIPCVVGVYPRERGIDQDVVIDLRFRVIGGKCIETDLLQDTLDYDQVAHRLRELVQREKFNLLETMAWRITEELFTHFPIIWQKVEIRKPGAIPDAKGSFVKLIRER